MEPTRDGSRATRADAGLGEARIVTPPTSTARVSEITSAGAFGLTQIPDLRASQIAADLGLPLATQLLLAMSGLLDEHSLRVEILSYFDRRLEETVSHLMPSGKQIVNADRVADWITTPRWTAASVPVARLSLLELLMDVMDEWQRRNPSVHLHKASVYYYAAMRDLDLHNVDRGLLYMNQAVLEDEISTEEPAPPAPATWFVTMDPTHLDQAAWDRVVAYDAVVERYLTAYRDEGLGGLTRSDLRTGLQKPELVPTAIALLHFVARLRPMTHPATTYARDNAFAGLAYAQILLELGQVFEGLLAPLTITSSGQPRSTLGGMLPHYAGVPDIAITAADCTAVRRAVNADLDTAAAALLDLGAIPGLRPMSTPERDVLLLYGVRNKAAHGLDRSSVVSHRFEELARRLLFAGFYLLEHRYLP